MSILNSVSTITNQANVFSSFANAAIVKPKDFYGIAGFVFDGIDSEEIDLENDITDHYIEDNTAIQDHIAVRPDIITLRGYVGELVSKAPDDKVLGAISAVNAKLQLLSAYLPQYTAQAQQLYSQIASTYQTALKAKQLAQDVWTKFKKKGVVTTPQTKQNAAYMHFKNLRDNRLIFDIDMYMEHIENVAILSVKPSQIGDNNMVTQFDVTFKKINFARIPKTYNTDDKFFQQSTNTNDLGTVKPAKDNNTALASLANVAPGAGVRAV